MSRRCGSSRTLGPTRQCAVYVRGGLVCAWCMVSLSSSTEASIDHLDADHGNNAPENLVPACRWCNRAREDDWTSGDPWSSFLARNHCWWDFDVYLAHRGAALDEAIDRVEAQRWQPLPLAAGRDLAAVWHANRIVSERARKRKIWDAGSTMRVIAREERKAIQGAYEGAEVTFP